MCPLTSRLNGHAPYFGALDLRIRCSEHTDNLILQTIERFPPLGSLLLIQTQRIDIPEGLVEARMWDTTL